MDAVVEFVFTVFFYGTARALVPWLTFGQVRVENRSDDGTLRFGWLGFARDSDGTAVMGAQLAAFVGLTLWIALIAVLYLLLR